MKHDSHGVNLFEISKKYGFKEEDIVDFSSNINPFGMPKSAKDEVIRRIDDLSTYPDPEYRSLKASIAKYTGASEEDILIGSGTSEIIANYIRYVNPKRAILLSPCYSEYENELRKIGSEIFYYDLEEENDFEIKIENLIEKINENDVELFISCKPKQSDGNHTYSFRSRRDFKTDEVQNVCGRNLRGICGQESIFPNRTYKEVR